MTQPTGKRSVKYVAPGHTQIKYATRVLDIRFRETAKEFQAKLKRAGKKPKTKIVKTAKTKSKSNAIYVDHDEAGNMIYVDAKGRDITYRVKASAEKGRNAIRSANIQRDKYTIEEMRAYLKDDHWEEVCGHKRWNYDNKSTVREFNKYLKRNRHLM